MYIIDIISCTNWLFALLGSYKKWSCAVQVVLRKELGRVQGRLIVFFHFLATLMGKKMLSNPIQPLDFSFGTEPLWPYRTAVPGFSKSDASRFS